MMKHLLGLLFLLLLSTAVNSQVIPGGPCTSSPDCVTEAVCIGTPNGACLCSNPYVNSNDNQTCVYSCTETLTAPTNGAVDTTEGNVNGDTAYYSCDAGYTLNGDATRSCDLVLGGWTGTAPTCDEIDECTSNPCQNGGFCNDQVNKYQCFCAGGYSGTHCETDVDECASNPCQNGATCTDGVNGFTCGCASGYTNTLCDGDVNECASNPCVNGICNNNVNSYNCQCETGYTDTNCDVDIDECASTPCQNGATCHDLINQFNCTCAGGYEDNTCSTETLECASNPCQNGATCNELVNMYTCTCVAGYESTHCEIDTNECDSNPCQNGATCNDLVNHYTCTCVPGYEGTDCEIDTDECASNPCQNGATCNDLVNMYTCDCVAGYESTHCEIETVECGSNPCQNGATCNDLVNQYTCTCVAGYESTHCEIDTNECGSNPCQNGATCNDQVNQYNCTCAPGYEAVHCEIDTDECASNPCQNGATCNDQVNQYTCTCVAGYESTHCEINTDECASNPCQNGATCNDQVNQYTCTCVAGYESTHCEIDTDECASNPCQNGATCNDLVNEYTCTCVAGYESTHCEIDTNECESNPCQNEATCNDFINYYNCTCKPGWADYNCDRDIDECVSLPCQNGGTCVDYINYFGCECQAGYTNVTCRQSVLHDLCHLSADVCVGILNAECDSSTCVCVTGYQDYDNQTCSRVDCGALKTPLNGEVDMSQGTLYEAAAVFDCDIGYTMQGVDTTICQATANWSESEPVCNIKECGALDALDNGQVLTPTGTQYTDIGTYSCNTGYILQGVETVTCQADATWSQAAPTCNIVDCLETGAPAQGSVSYSPNTLYLGYADFSCDTGYTLTGTTRRQCQADGAWSSTTPTCVVNDCGTLNAPSDGSITLPATIYTSVATFECNVGYDLTGSSSRVCQADTRWNGSTTQCVIKDCGAPTAPANGNVNYALGTKYLNNATFTCNTGYTLNGVSTRECQPDGTWQSPFPTCVINDCGSLTAALNTFIDTSGGTVYNSIATYTCAAGYAISTNTDKRTCQADETWTTPIPACSRIDCGTLLTPSNGLVDLTAGILFEATALFSCNTGYTLNGDLSTVCQSDMTWSNPNPSCIIKDCGTPGTPTHGSVALADGTLYEAEAVFSCETGYTMDDASSASRTCLSTGAWENPFPTCVINDCFTPTPLANTQVDVSSGTTYQSEATYTCDTGYELATGNDRRTCQADSTWSTPEPFCNKKDCGSLTNPGNGVVTNAGTLYLNVATYSCNAGYTLNGVTSRTCQSTGVWDGTTPVCEINDCGSLSSPTDGDVDTTSGTSYLQLAQYTCDTGYDLTGSTTRTCQADGTWSSTEPTCIIKNCGGLTAPGNGAVNTDSGTTYGQTASYTCDTGYNLVGVSSRNCMATGVWSDSVPSCVIKDCGSPPSVSNGQSAVFTTTYLSYANYTCGANYGLIGTASVVCLSTGNWDTLPTCVPDCGIPESISDASVSFNSGTLEGAVATYTCDGGYTMNGGATVTCQSDGTWSSSPTCTINLENYNSVCHTVLQCQTDRASCLDDGTGTARCLCNTVGQYYDSSVDSCLTDCGGLANPTNGIVTLPTQTVEGQTATYTCNAGYALSGDATRECAASGSWSRVAPTCITGCALPDPPLHGLVNDTQGLTAGSAIFYSCNTGYAIVGQTSRICLTDSTFNGEQPECKRECSVLSGIKYGTVDLSLGNWEGSLATYICDKNYALVGQSTRLCEATGMWTGTEATCIFSVFPDIILVFGALFIFLILVDLIVLIIFLYKKFFKKKLQKMKDEGEKEEEKKPAFLPFMVERPEDTAQPPPSYSQNQTKNTKFSKIASEPEDDEGDLRNRRHAPPKKPLAPLKMADRPSYYPQKEKKFGRGEKSFELSPYDHEKEKFRGGNITTVNSYKPAGSVEQEDKGGPQIPEMENKGPHFGDHQKRAHSEDNMSLNDFDLPKPKTPMEDPGSKFVGRFSMPQGPVPLPESVPHQEQVKGFTDDSRKHMNKTLSAYSLKS